jgi:hypothetical protein
MILRGTSEKKTFDAITVIRKAMESPNVLSETFVLTVLEFILRNLALRYLSAVLYVAQLNIKNLVVLFKAKRDAFDVVGVDMRIISVDTWSKKKSSKGFTKHNIFSEITYQKGMIKTNRTKTDKEAIIETIQGKIIEDKST